MKPPFERALTAEELARLPDEAIDTSDIPELDENWFAQARLVPARTPGKTQVTVRLDHDVLEWFRAGGGGYQTRINAVLRAYVEASRRAEETASTRGGGTLG